MSKNDMPSPMWKMPLNGVTSEDFMRQKNQNNTRAFYNKMWRFKNDADAKADRKRQEEERAKAKLTKNKSSAPPPLKTELTKEAKKQGLPVPQSDSLSQEEIDNQKALDAAADAENTGADDVTPTVFSEDELRKLPKDQLVEIAAAAGVANTALSKGKLIDAILEKQG